MDYLSEAVGHALENTFVVNRYIAQDEKFQDEAEQTRGSFWCSIKPGTLITVNSVTIYDDGIYAEVTFPENSLTQNALCGLCSTEGKCANYDAEPCPANSVNIALDMLVTHCDVWEEEQSQFTLLNLH